MVAVINKSFYHPPPARTIRFKIFSTKNPNFLVLIFQPTENKKVFFFEFKAKNRKKIAYDVLMIPSGSCPPVTGRRAA